MSNAPERDPMEQIRALAADAKERCDGIMELVNRALMCSLGDEPMSDKIADSVDFLRFFIDAAPILAVELIAGIEDPIMIRTTRALEELFEYAPGELNGRPISILVPPTSRTAHRGHIRGFLEHPTDRQMGNLGNVKPEGITKSGAVFPIVLTWKRFFVDTRPFLAGNVNPQVRLAGKE